MPLAWALELTYNFVSTPNSPVGLDSLLDPSLVEQALEQAGVATLRKRRLPLPLSDQSWPCLFVPAATPVALVSSGQPPAFRSS